jgi:hypothetical protein
MSDIYFLDLVCQSAKRYKTTFDAFVKFNTNTHSAWGVIYVELL